MKLREVDYDRTMSPNKTQTQPADNNGKPTSKRAVYMEIDLPKAVPKTKAKKQRGASPLRRSDASAADQENREERHRERRGKHHKVMVDEAINASVQVGILDK